MATGPPRVFVGNATDDTTIEMTFALPSLTSFDRLAVPQILEVPGPSVTFFRNIEVLGAVGSLDGPFVTLAGGALATHESDGEVTELQIVSDESVDFVKIRLSGGINIIEDLSGFEFSELIGNGTQQPVALVEGFTGIWDAKLPDTDRSIGLIELDQDGAIVTGCFGTTDLTGSVTGNLVRMTGVDRFDSVLSAYIFALNADGTLQGVASTNGGPFGFVPSEIAPKGRPPTARTYRNQNMHSAAGRSSTASTSTSIPPIGAPTPTLSSESCSRLSKQTDRRRS